MLFILTKFASFLLVSFVLFVIIFKNQHHSAFVGTFFSFIINTQNTYIIYIVMYIKTQIHFYS